ncbi:MAG: hypothetical protein KBD06_00200 [Candidatus Pacebacteria bacterium]|nr:hypothetical protein [Candidatus Paceibacterota bacterium]
MENEATKKQSSIATLIGVAVVLALIAGLLLSLSNIASQQRMYAIATFQECKEAGYPIMESYPEQCATPDGRTFSNDTQSVQMPPPQTGIVANGCAISGCSMQLCISAEEAAAGGGVSTCEFRPEYACYREASCEVQADGKCGWTQSDRLSQCLATPPTIEDPQAI